MKRKEDGALFAGYRRAGIKTQLLTIAGMLTALLCGVILIFYGRMAGSLRENSYKEAAAYVDEVGRSIAVKCDTYNRFLGFIAFSETIQDFVTADPDNTSRWIEQTNQVNTFFHNTRIFHDDIIDIIVMDHQGKTYGLTRNFRETDPRIRESLELRENYHYSEIIDFRNGNYPKEGVIVATRIYSINPHQSLYDIGAVALVIQPDGIGLSETALRQSTPIQLFVLDKSGRIFSRSGQETDEEAIRELAQREAPTFRTRIDGQWYMAYVRDVDVFAGKLVALVSEKEVLAQAGSARDLALVLLAASVALLSFPVYWTVRGVINPIRSLSAFMGRVAASRDFSKLNRRIQLGGCREAREMAGECNRMLDTIQNLTQTVIRKDKDILGAELERKQAELSFLQSQINPHFLCNTFDSIKGLAALHGEAEIRSMANDLSLLFRYSIRPGERVPLRDELDAVERYVRIQKTRFGQRFSVCYQIPEETKDISVPKMILQPLVENAIIHGVEVLDRDGRLVVESELSGGDLLLRVRDNGGGMEPEKLERMRRKLSGAQLSKDKDIVGYRAGIGVVNVNNRIRLTYGEEYGVTIDSSPGQGTVVTLRMRAEEFGNVWKETVTFQGPFDMN